MSLPPSEDIVTISERGGQNPRQLVVAQPSCSWELSNAGQMSCFATLESIRDAGLPLDLKGAWLTWESPAGEFGGVITGRPITDGVAEIAAMSFAVLMRGRVLSANWRAISAPAGAILRRALQDVIGEQPLFITPGVIDEDGLPLTVSYEGADLYNDVLSSVAGDSGHEWHVDADRVLTFSRYVGEDRSNSVRLVEGRHIAGYRVADDLWLLANELIGVSAETEIEKFMLEDQWLGQWARGDLKKPKRKRNETKKARRRAVKRWKKRNRKKVLVDVPVTHIDPYVVMSLDNLDSIDKYGPLQMVRTYDDTRDPGTIEARIRAELEALANPSIALEMTLVDADNCYRRFAEGDVVWVDIGSAGLAGAFRVVHRSYDSGGLRVAGDLNPIGIQAV